MTDNKARAFQRIQELIQIGLRADDSSAIGPLSRADFDELMTLSEVLASSLPKRFLAVISEGYKFHAFEQGPLAERLDRAIKVQETYGEVVTTENTSELAPTFELESDERDRVLVLSSQMRKIVFASSAFDEPHKRRLLNRIAAVENEINQPKGKLDVILAGVSDLGDTLKKFGGDLKPLTDRYREIKNITQSKSDAYSQIPPPEELDALPPPDPD